MIPSLSSLSPFLFHIILSLSTFLLHHFLNLPSLFLHGLHTYIHPDSLPSDDSLRAVIRRPSDLSSPNPKSKSKKSNPNSSQFDESKSQLFRLRLADSLLSSRHSSPSYRLAFLLSLLSLTNLSLSLLSPTAYSSPSFSTVSSLPISTILLLILLSLSSEKSASKKSQKHLSLLASLLGSVTVFFALAIDFLDFDIGCGKTATSALAGLLAGSTFIPATRAARSFWLGTDQLRWSLTVVSCPTHQRFLLYVAALANVAGPMLWVGPVAAAAGQFKEYRVGFLAGCAALQLLAVRPNLQMYLNEAVLSWYQRLHSGRVPDLDYGRAKVFLHNHYLCLVAAQFFAPPALVLVLLGMSQMEGDLFGGDAVKVVALFLGWWIVFVWGVVMVSSLSLYRTGVLFVS